MTDRRFHHRMGPFTLAELADFGAVTLSDDRYRDVEISDIAPLDVAIEGQLGFLDNTAYLAQFAETKAAACIVSPRFQERAPESLPLLLSEQPYHAFALIAQAFYPRPMPQAGIASSAAVSDKAGIDISCEIAANVVIEDGVKLAANVVVGPSSVIGAHVEIGANTIIGPNVTLSHCLIGERVTLHPGVRIGQDGFGFAPNPRGHQKVPQVGRVIIGDDCDIGANTTIDRGSLQDTVIGPGCWIDNLVQIAHNVEIGRGSIIVAQTGIAGSTKIGNFVALGGQVGIAGHLEIGDGAQIAAQSGVMTKIPAGTTYCGSPAVPIKDFFRQTATIKKLANQRGSKK